MLDLEDTFCIIGMLVNTSNPKDGNCTKIFFGCVQIFFITGPSVLGSLPSFVRGLIYDIIISSLVEVTPALEPPKNQDSKWVFEWLEVGCLKACTA